MRSGCLIIKPQWCGALKEKPVRKLIADFFADKVETKRNRFGNGYTVVRVTIAWHGGVKDVEVIEKRILWTWPL